MRIAFDLDGVICSLRDGNQSYEDLQPIDGAIERLTKLKAAGHTILIYTARRMGSSDGNVGKALKQIGRITFDWLAKYGVVYDEIYFGKPSADIYIDDKGWRFTSWEELTDSFLENNSSTR